MLLAVLLAAAPATAQVAIGLTVSATGTTAAIGVAQKNKGARGRLPARAVTIPAVNLHSRAP